MAILAISAIGATIGTELAAGSVLFGMTGAQIGWMAGSIIGNALFGPEGQDQEGPRLEDKTVTSTTEGAAIPIVYGTSRVAGQIIWADDLVEHAHTQSSGGKGFGGGSSYTSYSYTASFAVSFGLFKNSKLIRIWANKKLIYDNSGTSSEVLGMNLNFKFYDGTQVTPDSTIEADVGLGNCPAYKGQTYIVFSDLDLTDYFGNRIPSIEIEVSTNATQNYKIANFNAMDLPSSASGTIVVNDGYFDGLYFWTFNRDNDFNIQKHYLYRQHINSNKADITFYYEDYYGLGTIDNHVEPGFFYSKDGTDLIDRYICLKSYTFANGECFIYDLINLIPLSSIQYTAVDGGPIGAFDARYLLGETKNTLLIVNVQFASPNLTSYIKVNKNPPGLSHPLYTLEDWGQISTAFVIDWLNDKYYFFASDVNGKYLLEGNTSYAINPKIYLSYGSNYIGPIDFLNNNWLFFGYIDKDNHRKGIYCSDLNETWYLVGDNTTSSYYLIQLDPDGKLNYCILVASAQTFDTLGRDVTSGSLIYKNGYICFYLGYFSGINKFYYFKPSTRELTSFASTAELNPTGLYFDKLNLQGSLKNTSVIANTTVPAFNFFKLRTHLNSLTIPIASVLESICQLAGINLNEIDTSQITNTLTGYVHTRLATAKSELQHLTTFAQLDAVIHDWRLTFIPKNKPALTTITSDKLGANEGLLPAKISVDFKAPIITDLPKKFILEYISSDQLYEIASAQSIWATGETERVINLQLPITLTDAEAASLVEYLHQIAINTATVKTTLTLDYLHLEPADGVIIDLGSVQHKITINKLDYGLNRLLKIEGVVYDESYQNTYAVAGGASNKTITLNGQVFYEPLILDVPLLRDIDQDHPGPYLVPFSFNGEYTNTSSLFTSIDDATYNFESSINAKPVIGTVLTVPSTLTDFGQYDFTNKLIVNLSSGSLSSTTNEALLAGANAFAWGQQGRWEICQFENATLIGTNQYELSKLLRGRRGTDSYVNLHQVDDVFILLQDATLIRQVLTNNDVGKTWYYKFLATQQTLAEAVNKSFTITNTVLKPYSPVKLTYAKQTNGDILITWLRRTRKGGSLLDLYDNVGGPLNEDIEQYKVEIYSLTGTLVRTEIVNTTSYTYLNSDRLADNLGSFSVKIYQQNLIVGDGFPSTELIVQFTINTSKLNSFVNFNDNLIPSDFNIVQLGTTGSIIAQNNELVIDGQNSANVDPNGSDTNIYIRPTTVTSNYVFQFKLKTINLLSTGSSPTLCFVRFSDETTSPIFGLYVNAGTSTFTTLYRENFGGTWITNNSGIAYQNQEFYIKIVFEKTTNNLSYFISYDNITWTLIETKALAFKPIPCIISNSLFAITVDNIIYSSEISLYPDENTSYLNLVQSYGAVAHWNLDETAGPTASDSFNNYPGTYTGAITFNKNPLVATTNTAVAFNEVGTLETTYNIQPSTSAFSVSCWFRSLKTLPTIQKVLWCMGDTIGNNAGQVIYVQQGARKYDTTRPHSSLVLGFGTNQWLSFDIDINDEKIHNLIVSVPSNAILADVKIFLDGKQLSGQMADSAININIGGSNQPFTIGAINSSDTVYNWHGTIDEVTFFTQDLNQAHAETIYRKGITCYHDFINFLDPYAYYPLSNTSTILDLSKNEYNSTLMGSGITSSSSLLANRTDNAILCDGASRIETNMPAITGQNPFTICAWVIFDSTNTDNIDSVFCTGKDNQGTNPGELLQLCYNSATTGTPTLALAIWDNRIEDAKYHNIKDDKLHFLCASGTTASSIKLYLDGIEVPTFITNPTIERNTIDLGFSYIGDVIGSIRHYHKGKIDEIAIFDKILSPEDILYLYRLGKQDYEAYAKNSYTIAYFKLDEVLNSTSVKDELLNLTSSSLTAVTFEITSFGHNTACNLTTISSFIDIVNTNSLIASTLSLSFIYQPIAQSGGLDSIISCFDTGLVNGFSICYDATNNLIINLYDNTGQTADSITSTIGLNSKVHIGVEWTGFNIGDELNLYINGTLVASKTLTQAWTLSSTASLRLGKSIDASHNSSVCYLDEVVLYNNLLGEGECKSMSTLLGLG